VRQLGGGGQEGDDVCSSPAAHDSPLPAAPTPAPPHPLKGVAFEKQRLTLGDGGKPLLDILCLADYPQFGAGGAATNVLVTLAGA
jgi:hypothetical protein